MPHVLNLPVKKAAPSIKSEQGEAGSLLFPVCARWPNTPSRGRQQTSQVLLPKPLQLTKLLSKVVFEEACPAQPQVTPLSSPSTLMIFPEFLVSNVDFNFKWYCLSSGCHDDIAQAGWLQQQNLFSCGSGGQGSNIKVLAYLLSGESLGFFLACRWSPSCNFLVMCVCWGKGEGRELWCLL